ncbi:MAG: hypothetical protein FWG59_01830, partial [Betaproteobacteria bacterium]|nr:hypothetical protein [Betaproteobacteria bacterium]
MHDLGEADRRLLDLLKQERQLSVARLKEERRDSHQKRLYDRCPEKDGSLPEIPLSEEFERLLAADDKIAAGEGCEAVSVKQAEERRLFDRRIHDRRACDMPVAEERRRPSPELADRRMGADRRAYGGGSSVSLPEVLLNEEIERL